MCFVYTFILYLQHQKFTNQINMNKTLFESVKAKTKDTGLSEKYLQEITESVGGDIADDSTDEAAIEEKANLIQKIAKASQGEATRWANKKKPETKPTEQKPEEKPTEDKPTEESESDKRIKALEEKIASMESEKTKGERLKTIAAVMEKHKIPAKFRDKLALTIGDEEDVEEAVKALKQDFITIGLDEKDPHVVKSASEQDVEEASEDLLKTISVPSNN